MPQLVTPVNEPVVKLGRRIRYIQAGEKIPLVVIEGVRQPAIVTGVDKFGGITAEHGRVNSQVVLAARRNDLRVHLASQKSQGLAQGGARTVRVRLGPKQADERVAATGSDRTL